MKYQYIPYTVPLIASAITTIFLGVYALLRRRSAKGADWFILSMFVVTIWSLGNALEVASIDFSTKLFWANIQYFAYCFSPVTLLAMCMEFTGYEGLLRNRKLILLAIIPTITIMLVWTDGLHGLIRNNLHMDYSGSFPVIKKDYGIFFYIHALYSHFLNFLAWFLLINTVFFKNTIYRKQASALLIGVSLIILPNILYIMGLSPIGRYDITPVFFGPTGLIIAWGIFRYRLFDVVPIARATVIENMDAGIMVLDIQGRVLDTNPSFRRMIKLDAADIGLKTVDEVCSEIPKLLEACNDKGCFHTEFITAADGKYRVNEAFLSPLCDNKGVMLGRLVVIYDVTEKKQEQQRYLKQQWKLAVTEERERLARDLHDNLGQVLSFINLQAQGIKRELANANIDKVDNKLDKLVGVSQAAHNDIREYIRNARNTETTDNGFMAGIIKNIVRFEEQSGLEAKLNFPSSFTGEELPPEIKSNLLYIIKEALNNINKHAKASNVSITFSYIENRLLVEVQDDGKGFDASASIDSETSSFGLNIMRERSTEIGAHIEVKSAPEKGTCIIVTVPINGGGIRK